MARTATVWDSGRGVSANDPRHRMSAQAFTALISVFTLAGIIFAMAIGSISYHWDITHWNTWALLGLMIGVVVASLIGTAIYVASDKPAFSAFGYILVAGPFGLLLGPIVAQYTAASVAKVMGITIAMVVILGLVGILIPEDLRSWGSWLLGGLMILLLGYFVVPFLGLFGVSVDGGMTILDWVGVALFGAIVVYDMNRAMRVPRTLDKAIDCAAGLFTDVVNIFIRLLSLLGTPKTK